MEQRRAHRAHNPKTGGSSPSSATTWTGRYRRPSGQHQGVQRHTRKLGSPIYGFRRPLRLRRDPGAAPARLPPENPGLHVAPSPGAAPGWRAIGEGVRSRACARAVQPWDRDGWLRAGASPFLVRLPGGLLVPEASGRGDRRVASCPGRRIGRATGLFKPVPCGFEFRPGFPHQLCSPATVCRPQCHTERGAAHARHD